MAGRDPAFLYYDADVALDVAHMNRLEKGCYLDLVQLYRRYHGYTMVQIRYILGNDFDAVWNALSLVLVLDDDKYHIQWLRNSLENKAERNKKQKENIEKRWAKEKEARKNDPNGNTMVLRSNNRGSTNVLPSNDIGNSIVIPIIETVTETVTVTEKDIGGLEGEGSSESETFESRWIPPEGPPWPEHASELPNAMVKIFVEVFPGYPEQQAKDFAACMQIAYYIADQNGWPWESMLNGRMPDLLAKWKELVQFAHGDAWFSTRSLSDFEKEYQRLVQKKRNGTAKKFTSTGAPVVQTVLARGSRNF